MNKDLNAKENKDLIYALNAVVENLDGDIGIIQNEPSNLLGIELKKNQKIIGSLFIPSQDRTLLFVTNSNNSDEILEFFSTNYIDDKLNVPLETVKQKPLIIPRTVISANFNWNVKNNFQVEYKITDCTINIYFCDGDNPDRFLYFDYVNNYLKITDDFKKQNYQNNHTVELNVEKCNFYQSINSPKIELSEIIGGNLSEGMYQFFVAYSTSKGIPLSSYLSNTNQFPIFEKTVKAVDGIEYKTNKAIAIKVSNVTVNSYYKYLNIIVAQTVNNNVTVKSIATIPINSTVEYIFTGNEDYIIKSITDVIQKYPYYKSSDILTSSNNYLLKANLNEFEKINIQRITNKVKLECVTVKVNEDFYKNGKNSQQFLNYCGDEVYSFGLELIYSNGEISATGHISGREATATEMLPIENSKDIVLGKSQWEVYNTAKLISSPYTDSVWEVFDFAFWQSTETYPNNPEIWGELSGKNIRHHKFPDSTIAHIHDGKNNIVENSYNKKTNLFIKGIRLKNNIEVILQRSLEEGIITKQQKDRITGYRIVRGNRAGEKTIIAKGLLYDMWSYKNLKDSKDVCANDRKIYYPNYPFNSLEPDVLLSKTGGHYKYENFEKGQQYPDFQTFNNERKYTFHSPDTHFLKPTVGDILKIETGEYGESQGFFNECKKQAQYKILTIKHYSIAILIARFIASNTIHKSENATGTGQAIGSTIGTIAGSAIPGVGTSVGGIVGGLIGSLAGGNNDATSSLQRNSIILFQTEKIIQIFKNLGDFQKLQYQYQAIGKYNNYFLPSKGNIQRKIINSQYLSSNKSTLNDLFINNSARESSLFLEVNTEIPIIDFVKDTSRFKINTSEKTQIVSACKKFKVTFAPLGQSFVSYINCDGVVKKDYFLHNAEFYAISHDLGEATIIEIPCSECKTMTSIIEEECNCKSSIQTSNISSYYASIKTTKLNQYGNVNNINYIDVDGIVNPINSINVHFGGDTFVTPFALKRKHQFFNNTSFNLPDDTDIFYEDLVNVAYPTYYFNTKNNDKNFKPNLGLIFALSNITDLGLPEYSVWQSVSAFLGYGGNEKFNLFKGVIDSFSASALDPNLWIKSPSHYLDCSSSGRNSNGKLLSNFSFQSLKGIIYLYYYGIPYFYCESEINTYLRTSKNNKESDFYPHQSDLGYWLQEENVPIKEDNFYTYDSTYSKQNKEGFHFVNDVNFKPKDCKIKHHNRIIYSSQSTDLDDSDLKDNYLINKALDYKDFGFVDGNIISLKGIENDKVLIGFENNTQVFNAYSTIQTNEGTALIGNGGIFQTKPKEFSKNKLGYIGNSTEIHSCEFGHVIIDAIRGDIFLLNPNADGVDSISQKGMISWFKNNLPFTITKYFKTVNTKNSKNGIGICVGYDKRFKRLLITKLDYEPKFKEITYDDIQDIYYYNKVQIYLEDKKYFYSKCWTISYNFITSSWISFHSYLPYKYIDNINYFMSVNDNSVWSHNLTNKSYQVFNGKLRPFELNIQDEYSERYKQILNVNFVVDSILHKGLSDTEYSNKVFNKAIVFNKFQSSGLLELNLVNRNNNHLLSKFPILTGNSTKISVTNKENIFSFNQFKNIKTNDPIFFKDRNNVYSYLNSNAHNNSFPINNFDPITSNVNYIKLINDNKSQYQLNFKLNSFNKLNSIR